MSWLAGQEKHGHDESDNLGVDWVLQYEFEDIGKAYDKHTAKYETHRLGRHDVLDLSLFFHAALSAGDE